MHGSKASIVSHICQGCPQLPELPPIKMYVASGCGSVIAHTQLSCFNPHMKVLSLIFWVRGQTKEGLGKSIIEVARMQACMKPYTNILLSCVLQEDVSQVKCSSETTEL